MIFNVKADEPLFVKEGQNVLRDLKVNVELSECEDLHYSQKSPYGQTPPDGMNAIYFYNRNKLLNPKINNMLVSFNGCSLNTKEKAEYLEGLCLFYIDRGVSGKAHLISRGSIPVQCVFYSPDPSGLFCFDESGEMRVLTTNDNKTVNVVGERFTISDYPSNTYTERMRISAKKVDHSDIYTFSQGGYDYQCFDKLFIDGVEYEYEDILMGSDAFSYISTDCTLCIAYCVYVGDTRVFIIQGPTAVACVYFGSSSEIRSYFGPLYTTNLRTKDLVDQDYVEDAGNVIYMNDSLIDYSVDPIDEDTLRSGLEDMGIYVDTFTNANGMVGSINNYSILEHVNFDLW